MDKNINTLVQSFARTEAWSERHDNFEGNKSGRIIMMKEGMANTDVTIVLTLAYTCEICTWHERIQTVNMNYLRGACGVNRVDGGSNKSAYGRSDICSKG